MLKGFLRILPLAALVVLGLSMSGRADERYSSGEEAYRPTLTNGDWNGDGHRNIGDVINMLQWLYAGDGSPPVPAACEPPSSGPLGPASSEVEPDHSFRYAPSCRNGDLNGNGVINITDVLIFTDFLFLGGDEPVRIECEPEEK